MHGAKIKMKTNLKIFCGISIFAIIAVANIAHAATTPVVNNKTSQFNDVLSEMGANATDSSNAALAETIRRQRALLDAAGDTGAAATGGTNITTANACDATLRKCMSEKCGADFTKCASDSTTVWGNKMDACRRNTKCTGHEYTLLAPEILADRNAAIELSYYNSVVNCGNRYNNCVFGICGKSLENCLSKSAGDSAIAKCKSIADECREQDSGLAARVMGVFGDRRNIAATEAQRDEKRLYELRDLMRTQCTRFGAMFDERTLDCVYTVNFFAGTDNTLMASKKLYSGDTFQCTPDWFGVDITTYMENAQRLTRSQTSASAAAMGAGLGTAASLWTSGAVMRGIDTQNAEKQAKEACTTVGGEWVSAGFNQGSKCDMRKPKADCEGQGYTWDDKTGCSGGNNNQNNNRNQNNQINTAPGETPCEAYENMQCSVHDDKCEWIQATATTKGYCKTKGTSYTPEQTLSIEEAQCNIFDSSICNGNGNCTWDPKQNNGSGKCVAITNSSTGGDRNQGRPSNNDKNNNKDTQNTNISTKVTTKKGNKISATIECGDKTAKPNMLGKISIKGVPQETTCKISAPNCQSQNIIAKNINDQIKLSCPDIDNCFGSDGKWENNACDCGETKKLEGTECKTKNIIELCEEDCQKYAKDINRQRTSRNISTIENQYCYSHCDNAFKQKCENIFGTTTAKMTKECPRNANACKYTCEYVSSGRPHPAS